MGDAMKIGFIGSGKMASALVQGAVQSGAIAPANVLVSDAIRPVAEKLADKSGVQVAANNAELCTSSDVIVLCVKPADALAALRDLRNELPGKLVVSIVAGLSLASLESEAGNGVRVVRVMPNTPALIHKGAAAYAVGSAATTEDGKTVEKLFGAVGTICQVKEPLLDVVTGLSGSGPAFAYLVVEALADGGVLMGLPRDLAIQLAAQTVAGSAEMILQTGLHPGVLRDQVTSPGGTTIAGIEALEKNGARAALISAVRAATERARELGKVN
jgi:pyrroline-5-carboxylate reductase